MDDLLAPVRQFLQCETPDEWVEMARDPARLPTLLIDHANCETKAALTAHSLVRRYCLPKGKRHLLPKLEFYRELDAIPEKAEILGKRSMGESDRTVFAELERNPLLFPMVRLIQEELHHFEQVLEIMQARGIEYGPVTASRYARQLMQHVRTHEPATIVDKMIIGAYIEARSCERFAKLAPHLDEELRPLLCLFAALRGASLSGLPEPGRTVRRGGYQRAGGLLWQAGSRANLLAGSQFRFHSGLPVTSDSC